MKTEEELKMMGRVNKMIPTKNLTLSDVERLRYKMPKSEKEVKEINEMKKHLETLYTGKVTLTFSEKIYRRNIENAYE